MSGVLNEARKAATRFRERHNAVRRETYKGGKLFRNMVDEVIRRDHPIEVVRECLKLMSSVGSGEATMRVLQSLKERKSKIDENTRFHLLRSAVPSKKKITLKESFPFCQVWETVKNDGLLPINAYEIQADVQIRIGRFDLAMETFNKNNRPKGLYPLMMRETQNLTLAWGLYDEMTKNKMKVKIIHLHALMRPSKIYERNIGVIGFIDERLREIQFKNRSNISKILQKMHEHDIHPTQFTFQEIISTAGNTFDLGLMRWAVDKFRILFQLDLESYCSLIRMCSEMVSKPNDEVELQAEKWYQMAISDGYQHPKLSNFLIHVYTASGNTHKNDEFKKLFLKDGSVKIIPVVGVKSHIPLVVCSSMIGSNICNSPFYWSDPSEEEDFKVLFNTQLITKNLIMHDEDMNDITDAVDVKKMRRAKH